MSAISAYSGSPGNSLTRLLLAGISGRSAVLAGAHDANAAELGRVGAVTPRLPDETNEAQPQDDQRQTSEDGSSHGPAAIYEPSEHALATVLRPKREEAKPGQTQSSQTLPSQTSPGQTQPGQTQSGESTDDTESGLGQKVLNTEEQEQVDKLEQRDQEVRRHEQAHKAAAGSHAAGGPSFEYQTGPDGRRYAVGGEVPIDSSPVQGNPAATIAKMQQIRRAALAPASPSGQDRQVAAQASQAEAKARAEQSEQKNVEQSGSRENSGRPDAPFAAFANTPTNTPPGQRLDVVG